MSLDFLKFGFIPKREKKEEVLKYEYPYIHVIPATEKKSVTKFKMYNTEELLGEEMEKISYFQIDNPKEFFLANTSTLQTPAQCKVNKDNSFNSKALYERLVKEWELEEGKELFLKLDKFEVEGEELKAVKISLIDEEPQEDIEEDIKLETAFE